MVNFLSLLGWNDGSEQEIFSTEELQSKFSLDRQVSTLCTADPMIVCQQPQTLIFPYCININTVLTFIS